MIKFSHYNSAIGSEVNKNNQVHRMKESITSHLVCVEYSKAIRKGAICP